MEEGRSICSWLLSWAVVLRMRMSFPSFPLAIKQEPVRSLVQKLLPGKSHFLSFVHLEKKWTFQMNDCHLCWSAWFSGVSTCLSVLIKTHSESRLLVPWSRGESLNFMAVHLERHV